MKRTHTNRSGREEEEGADHEKVQRSGLLHQKGFSNDTKVLFPVRAAGGYSMQLPPEAYAAVTREEEEDLERMRRMLQPGRPTLNPALACSTNPLSRGEDDDNNMDESGGKGKEKVYTLSVCGFPRVFFFFFFFFPSPPSTAVFFFLEGVAFFFPSPSFVGFFFFFEGEVVVTVVEG